MERYDGPTPPNQLSQLLGAMRTKVPPTYYPYGGGGVKFPFPLPRQDYPIAPPDPLNWANIPRPGSWSPYNRTPSQNIASLLFPNITPPASPEGRSGKSRDIMHQPEFGFPYLATPNTAPQTAPVPLNPPNQNTAPAATPIGRSGKDREISHQPESGSPYTPPSQSATPAQAPAPQDNSLSSLLQPFAQGNWQTMSNMLGNRGLPPNWQQSLLSLLGAGRTPYGYMDPKMANMQDIRNVRNFGQYYDQYMRSNPMTQNSYTPNRLSRQQTVPTINNGMFLNPQTLQALLRGGMF